MRHQSPRRKRLIREVKPIRDGLLREVGQCEICGTSPKRQRIGIPELSQLCCHEIACGPLRHKALGCRFALLVLCWGCNTRVMRKATWPEARQLAVLRRSRPGDYDLAAYNRLVNENAPERITDYEVSQWTR